MPPWLVDDMRAKLIRIVQDDGLDHLSEPIELASGELSYDFIDGKRALASGAHLKFACDALVACVRDAGVDFDAIGGLTLGADQFAHGIAVLTGASWFVVRKQLKDHGTKRRIEGARLKPGVRVLLVDDVVTSGGSILEALNEIEKTGAEVVFAVTLVDRGEVARKHFGIAGIPYQSLVTYKDLGIEPVGSGQVCAEATG